MATLHQEVEVNNTKTVQVRDVPEELWDAVRIQAINRKMTISEYVVYVLRSVTKKG